MRQKLEDIALRAGERILSIYQQSSELSVEKKHDGSPVTEADLAAHKILASSLETLSGLPVVSEEDLKNRAKCIASGDYWLIDPLDGTKDFIQKSAMFTVNIALIHRHQAIAGVVYAPALDELYSAWDDQAFFNRQPIVRSPRPADQEVRALVSALHPSREVEEFLAENQIKQIERVGSSLKFCRVAIGQADIYPRLSPTSEWDTAAGQAVAEATGCVVLSLPDLRRLHYSKPEVLNPWFLVYCPGDIPELRWRGKHISP